MQHNTSECRTGTGATKSPALALYFAPSKYTNRATNKSNATKCTHALAAVSAVAMNPLTSVTNRATIPPPPTSASVFRTKSNTSALVKDAYAAHR